MSRIFGRAQLDPATGQYYYQIETDTGQVLTRSDPVFADMDAAEAELIVVIRGLAQAAEPLEKMAFREKSNPWLIRSGVKRAK
jgi:hypothetical protein